MTGTLLLVSAAFVLSALCGFIFIPMILNFCKEKNLYDIPNSRKMHLNATPRLGGISFLPSMFLAFIGTMFLFNSFTGYDQVTFSLWSLYFFISLALVYGVGLIDDLIGLGAKTKFSAQIMAAFLMPLAGLYFNDFYGFLGIQEIPYYLGAPLTIFLIVFITNSINLIDGIDGLAAGLSFIALMGFLICLVSEGLELYGILIAGLMGVLVPFLYFNLFGDPAKNRKLFMGDSGSLTLGFILGFLAVKYSMDNPNVMFWRPDCLLLSYTFLIVPTFDVVRVSAARFFHHTPVFKADKNHIHHKLIRAGLTQHQTLGCILLLALTLIGVNLLLSGNIESTYIVVIDITVWIIFHQIVNIAIRKKGLPVFLIKESDE
jgi:UDP-N-acetylmuramyl pentapeptide phosphotransferase/UDP-N-acetylglucosamine-1-phosphate transferase